MQPQAPEQSAIPDQSGLPLWLGALLLLLVLLVPHSANAHEGTFANSAISTSLEFSSPEASPASWLTTPPDMPHCHHGYAARQIVGGLPRVAPQDSEDETVHHSLRDTDTPPRNLTQCGVPRPPTLSSAIPVYLLTQRFRS